MIEITLIPPPEQPYRWRSVEEGVRMALDRKRRMRLIYKWRHGLPRTHQPAHRDRGKLRYLAAWEAMRVPAFMEPLVERFAADVAYNIMRGN